MGFKLEHHEEFIGLYQVESTRATVLVGVVHDVLQRMILSITKIRGQCYAMMGPHICWEYVGELQPESKRKRQEQFTPTVKLNQATVMKLTTTAKCCLKKVERPLHRTNLCPYHLFSAYFASTGKMLDGWQPCSS